jgi:regulation of enolase protein 1 (concanavalin A-like superfamily)
MSHYRSASTYSMCLRLIGLAIFAGSASLVASGPPVSDDFNTSSLNTSLWTVVNPVGDGTVSANGAEALLSVPAGTTHDLWTAGNQSVRILQPISNSDFSIEVKFDSAIQSSIQDEGIIVAQDANNYLRFDIYRSGSITNYFSASFANNNPTVYANNSIGTQGAPLWFRVQRQGNNWTATWSTDGVNFTPGASFTYIIAVAQIGPFVANNGSPAPAFTASVDYFHNLSTLTPTPDLTLTKSHTGNFTQGGVGSYTLTVNNVGSAASSGTITVVDTLPTSLTPSGTAGSGWTCSINAQTVSCTSSSVIAAANSSTPITLSVLVSNSAPASVTNTATVSGGGETNTTNDSASDPTTISAAGVPDLTLTKTHAGSFTKGSTGIYTLTVGNINAAASNGVVKVIDSVPAGLTPTAATGTSWSCAISGQTVTCTNSTSIPGNGISASISLTVSVASNAASNLTNTATVSGGGETNTSNDLASDPTTIVAAGGPVSDDFHANSLNTTLWQFVNPVGDGSVRLNGTHALLSVPAGTSHDVWNSGNNSARIMQSISNSDFDVQVKFDSAVDQACQEQGLIVQQDATNYIRFDVYSNGPNVNVFAASFVNNSPTTLLNSSIGDVTPVPLYLRVRRAGNTFTYQSSTDGSTYTTLVSFNRTLTVKQIGPFSGNNACGFTAPAFTASVDFFFNTASPIIPQDGVSGSNPIFTIWNGDTQTFGNNGIPQTWVNILGNVLSPNGAIQNLQYTLNGGSPQQLSVGATSSRLPQPGDFDVEIPYSSLNPGANTVSITATDGHSNTTSHTVTVNYVSGQTWPLPYAINWTPTTDPQSVLQIIDGNWLVQPDGSGLRTQEVGYDRLLTIGNSSTWKDYVATAEVTLHYISDFNLTPPANHNDSDFGVGILVGWHGHTSDIFGVPQNVQPNIGHPFPAVGWYSSAGGHGGVLQLYQNTATHIEQVMAFQPSSGLALQFETKYIFKIQVTLNSGGTSSHYSFKVWPSGTTEPSTWNVQSDGDVSQGSIVLVAHRSDVTFGQVSVSQLP